MAVTKKDKNVYKIDVFLGYDSNGKRKRHIETFHGGVKEARAREAEIKASTKNGTFVKNNKLTFGIFAEQWLKEHANIHLAPKTVSRYEGLLKRIIPEIGHLKLKDISPLHLNKLYNNLRETTNRRGKQFSETTIRHYYGVVNKMLNTAVAWELMAYNPNEKITKPKRVKTEAKCYDKATAIKFISYLQNEPLKYRSLLTLALDTGMRKGEITGLEWDNVDLDNLSLKVVKSTQYISGKGIIEKSPKNDSSIRTVRFSKATAECLKEYKLEVAEQRFKLGSQWVGSNKVFVTDLGDRMHPDTPYKIFKKIIRKYELPDIPFHALRHTSVSLLIASNLHTKLISKRVGHSSTRVTEQTYAHIFEEQERQAAEAMDNILNLNNYSNKYVS